MTRNARLLVLGADAIIIALFAPGALVCLAACSTAAATKRDSHVASPTSSASVAEYASALKAPIANLQKAYREFNDQGCPSDDSSPDCQIMPLRLGSDAQTIVSTIDGLEVKTSQNYVGSPPAEIAKLTEDTYSAAQTVADDLDDPQQPGGWLAEQPHGPERPAPCVAAVPPLTSSVAFFADETTASTGRSKRGAISSRPTRRHRHPSQRSLPPVLMTTGRRAVTQPRRAAAQTKQ